MMEKFTKGPWLWSGASSVLVSGGIPLCCLVNSAVNTGDATQDYADAALISVSPEMYEELSDAVKLFELLIDNSAVNALYLPALYEQVERIEALRSKARGEQ